MIGLWVSFQPLYKRCSLSEVYRAVLIHSPRRDPRLQPLSEESILPQTLANMEYFAIGYSLPQPRLTQQ